MRLQNHKETPEYKETPKHKYTLRHKETPKRKETPKHKETPRHRRSMRRLLNIALSPTSWQGLLPFPGGFQTMASLLKGF